MKQYSRFLYIVVSLLLVAYSTLFVFNSSFVLSNGRRYFCLADDAMISMQYAWNFSHGLGLVWNHGERIEGYTNPLMVALMSLVTYFFDKRISCLVIQVLGIGILLGCAFLCSLIIMQLMSDDDRKTPIEHQWEHRSLQSMTRTLGFLAPMSYYPLIYWTLMGMETGLLTLVLLGIIYAVFKWGEFPAGRHVLFIAVLSGLAYLTRPDSVIPVSLLFVYLSTRLMSNLGFRRAARYMIIFILVFGAIIAVHFSLRWFYYGHLWPNTFVLKALGMSRVQFLLNGWAFIKPFFDIPNCCLLVLSLLACIFDYSGKRLTLLAMFASLVAYQILIGGDAWQRWRILCPIIPLLLLVAILEIQRLVLACSKTAFFQEYFLNRTILPVKYVPHLLIAGLFLLLIAGINRHFALEMFSVHPKEVNANRRHCEIAVALSELTRAEASVGVFWAGAIPYYSNRYSVDFLGKCDEVVSRLPPDTSGSVSWAGMFSVPGHNKYDLDYSIKKLMPDYVEGLRYGRQNLSEWGSDRYLEISWHDVKLYLKKASPNVFWHKIAKLSASTNANKQ